MNNQHLWLNGYFSHVQLFITVNNLFIDTIIMRWRSDPLTWRDEKSLLTKKWEAMLFSLIYTCFRLFILFIREFIYSAWTKSTSVTFCKPGVSSEAVNANVGLKFVCSSLFRLFCPLALLHAYLLLRWWMGPRVCCLNWRLRCRVHVSLVLSFILSLSLALPTCVVCCFVSAELTGGPALSFVSQHRSCLLRALRSWSHAACWRVWSKLDFKLTIWNFLSDCLTKLTMWKDTFIIVSQQDFRRESPS